MTRARAHSVGTWILIAGVVAVTGTGIADAATGGSLVLGHSNKATATTTLRNTKGTPLSLVAPAGKAPLAVSNSTKVARLNADKLDGLDSTKLQRRVAGSCAAGAVASIGAAGAVSCRSFQAALVHTIVVHPMSTAAESGAALLAAYGTAAASATAQQPWEVFLEPGTYDISGTPLALHADVQLSGSGQDVSVVQSGDINNSGVITGHDGAVMTDLTVLNKDPNTSADSANLMAYFQVDGTTTLRRVAIIADGAGVATGAAAVQSGGSPASSAAVIGDDVTLLARDATSTNITYAVFGGHDVFTQSSVIATGSASTNDALFLADEGTITFAGSKIVGSVVIGAFNSSTPTCVNSYDGSYTPLSASCG